MEKKKRMNIYSIEDQMSKYGITEEEANEKIRQIKNVNVFSIDWQMKKFNLSRNEAEKKISDIKSKLKESQNNMSEFDFNSMIPSKKEHWIKKGYKEEEAIELVKKNIEVATKNCNSFIEEVKINPDLNKKMNTNIHYWLEKGYSEDEARKILSKRQSTFNLEKCISKYGENEGYKIWKDRQVKWYSKTKDKLSKGDYLKFDSILKEFNGDENMAHQKFVERVININKSNFGKASKRSLKIFKQLIDICSDNNIEYNVGIDGNSEYYLYDKKSKKIYFYDFTISELNLIFEFNGKLFHSKDKGESKYNIIGVDIHKKYDIDLVKKELAERNGFEIVYLWEEDGFESNIKKSISIVRDRLDKAIQ
jgi:hypothetical protein